jgi:predicted nucleic acid-binding protein
MRRTALPDSVFTDTSAYFALSYTSDASHASAQVHMRELAAARCRLYTSNFIAAELHALLLTRINRFVAATALATLDASQLTTMERVTEGDELRAREIIARYTDKDFSLTDATSFAIMERLGISHAFTYDRNFAQYGWAVIGLEQP